MPIAAGSAFAPYRRSDRTFFLAMAAIAWVAILAGFAPGLARHATGASPFPSAIILVHAALFFGWLALFTVQIWLIRSKRVGLHRRLGTIGAIMVPLMVVLGLEANVVAQRAHFDAGKPELNFMFIPIADMILFGCLAATGLLLRKRAAAHKRLMLLATIALLDAGFGRWTGDWFQAHWGDGFFGFYAQLFLCSDLLIVAGMVYDATTRGRVHPVYLVAFPLILATQFVASAIYHAPGWIPIARYLIS